MIRQFDKEWYLTEWQDIQDGQVVTVTKLLTKLMLGCNCRVDLPFIPIVGTQIAISVGGDWAVNNSIIDPRGKKIMRNGGQFILDINTPIGLVYKDEEFGYIFSKF